jgi:hypothetical protein
MILMICIADSTVSSIIGVCLTVDGRKVSRVSGSDSVSSSVGFWCFGIAMSHGELRVDYRLINNQTVLCLIKSFGPKLSGSKSDNVFETWPFVAEDMITRQSPNSTMNWRQKPHGLTRSSTSLALTQSWNTWTLQWQRMYVILDSNAKWLN